MSSSRLLTGCWEVTSGKGAKMRPGGGASTRLHLHFGAAAAGMASREEQLAIERALAYENGVTYMSDRAAGAELDTKVKLHRYAQRQPAQRPAEGDKKRKKRKSKVPPWDRPKKKAVKKYAKVKDGSLTPLAELENKEELAEQDIEGEEDEGNDSDAACPTVVPTGSTNTRRVVQDPGTTFSKTIPQSPISVNSRSSPPPMHLESSSWADTSGSSDSSLPLRPPGGVLPTAAPASLQRAHAYPSPSSNVDADAGPSSSSVIKPNQYWSGGLAAYVPLFASVGIFREEDLWKIAPAAHAERFVCEFLTEVRLDRCNLSTVD